VQQVNRTIVTLGLNIGKLTNVLSIGGLFPVTMKFAVAGQGGAIGAVTRPSLRFNGRVVASLGGGCITMLLAKNRIRKRVTFDHLENAAQPLITCACESKFPGASLAPVCGDGIHGPRGNGVVAGFLQWKLQREFCV
jgi:hypothetical protein